MKVLGVEVPPAQAEREPVLDVPAIDMTDTASEAVVAVPIKKPGSSPSANRSSTTRPTKKAAPKPTRDGSVGRETFKAVEALVKDGKNKSEAFKQVAEATGRNVGTVQAAYYRVARASGAVKLRQSGTKAVPATRRGPQMATQSASRSGVRAGKGTGSMEHIVSRLTASIAALTDAVRAQDADVREMSSRLASVRRLLS